MTEIECEVENWGQEAKASFWSGDILLCTAWHASPGCKKIDVQHPWISTEKAHMVAQAIEFAIKWLAEQ